jgi:hypothetical protein
MLQRIGITFNSLRLDQNEAGAVVFSLLIFSTPAALPGWGAASSCGSIIFAVEKESKRRVTMQ